MPVDWRIEFWQAIKDTKAKEDKAKIKNIETNRKRRLKYRKKTTKKQLQKTLNV